MKRLKLIILLPFFASHLVSAQESREQFNDISVNGEQIYLSAMPDKSSQRVSLQWSCTVETKDNFFTIERSVDGKVFEVIGVIKLKTSYAGFTDEKPSSLRNHYRIRSESKKGERIYSRVATVGLLAPGSLKFYPNPVQKILVVRTENPVELRITDGSGKLRVQRQIPSGLQLVDLSAIEKGLYIITLHQKDSNTVISEKLLKE